MPRPKGSKNKVHTPRAARTAKNKIDYAALIAEKTAAKEQAEATVAALTANIDELKAQLKTARKVAMKLFRTFFALCSVSVSITRPIASTTYETKAAENAKKAEAEAVLKKLLASGMSAEEIVSKLQ